ncbi:MAG TPA: A24 family peptidase [Candidatus Limnocylindrales bacterium]|nr:A24 family peptidase [Candidatus Limnocylindrales bacterium]
MVIVGAIIGAAWGFASDRIAARWPAHEDGSIRPIDWRTPIVVVVGAGSWALLADRFGGNAGQLALMGLYLVALILLFATDLDQRLLPDVVTYPLIALALVGFLVGVGPYVHDPTELGFAAAAAVGLPLFLYLLSIPFGAGAIGLGDLKLLVSVGLLGGPLRLLVGLIGGAIIGALAIVALIVLRRITLRSYVPYGPFLIVGAIWALLSLTDM